MFYTYLLLENLQLYTRKGFLRKNIVAVLISRIFSLKINKLPIFSEITQE